MLDKYIEYKICKERGHKKSGYTTAGNPQYNICAFCGASYRWSTPTLMELNVPKPP